MQKFSDHKFANHIGYSDVNPYEIVRAVSGTTLEIREMDTERDESVKMEFAVGGFSAHCTNQQDQKWFIKSNESYNTFRIRFSKRHNAWKCKDGRKFILGDEPLKFYDFNF